MLYPKSREPALAEDRFRNPGAEYRGMPFWGWMGPVSRESVLEQIGQFGEMGMGGAYLHPRSITEPVFLSPEYMDLIRACRDYFAERGMLTGLYDENGCPSGSAGGLATVERQYRQKYLLFTPEPDAACAASRAEYEADEGLPGYCLGQYEVVLQDGLLADYRLLMPGESGDNVWYAYFKVCAWNTVEDGIYYRNYLDHLNPEAVVHFAQVGYDPYHRELGEFFGGDTPTMFTDEPQIYKKGRLNRADERRAVRLPFTDDFEESYRAAFGESLLAHLPELFWELPEGQFPETRYRYHEHAAARFDAAYFGTLGRWCREHGILLTGHLMAEESLMGMVGSAGDTMRFYRNFDIPGIDMLVDHREYTTAKQTQSAAHQYGCEGVMSEIYGVTDWDFDFRRHKLAGDWQAALGVTHRVHHITWATMESRGKRDYPAAIGHQSPWYREYPMIENHFARLNTAMTRGKPIVRVGVIHPVESTWLYYGCGQQTDVILRDLEASFQSVTRWLLYNQLDFDFICEATLPEQYQTSEDGKLHVGEMAYDTVLVPDCVTMRRTTLEALRQFAARGGQVVFAGAVPVCLDGKRDDAVRIFAAGQRCVPLSERQLVDVLKDVREIRISGANGGDVPPMLYQLRQDGESRWLFLSHCEKPKPLDGDWIGWFDESGSRSDTRIEIRGSWKPELYDTLSGEISEPAYSHEAGFTVIQRTMYSYDSLLLKLTPCEAVEHAGEAEQEPWRALRGHPMFCGPEGVPVTLHEPNVLLLDLPQWRQTGKTAWQPMEYVIRLQQELAKELPPDGCGTVELRYVIRSRLAVSGVLLALERPNDAEIWFNGKHLEFADAGWYVDRAIRKTALPEIPAGESELILRYWYTAKKMLEPCYLLGDFSVQVRGFHAQLGEPVRYLTFGDWNVQGLPFYAGSVTYHCCAGAGGGYVRFPRFSTPLLRVEQDGVPGRQIAIPPYVTELENPEGNFDVIAFGNRYNTFGAVHCAVDSMIWHGAPYAWQVEGVSHSWEYRLKPSGILQTPLIYR